MRLVTLATAVLFAGAAPYAFAESTDSAARLTDSQQEQFLKTGKITRTRPASKGVAGTTRVTMTDGKITHDAHVQCIDESRTQYQTDRGTELNFRDSYKFNIAAYRLARLLGIENLPVTVERKVAGKTCAVDWWVDDVMMDEAGRKKSKMQAPDPDTWNRQMHVVRVFDQLIFNVDRNLGNLLILKNWDIVMIDHSRSFRLAHTLENPKNLVMCDRTLFQKLRALDRAEVTKALIPYCTRMEVDAAMARRDRIVQLFEKRIRQSGEAAVLYNLHPAKSLSAATR